MSQQAVAKWLDDIPNTTGGNRYKLDSRVKVSPKAKEEAVARVEAVDLGANYLFAFRPRA